jgi:hypothetical protein
LLYTGVVKFSETVDFGTVAAELSSRTSSTTHISVILNRFSYFVFHFIPAPIVQLQINIDRQ